jgi:uncharacterized membrane protein
MARRFWSGFTAGAVAGVAAAATSLLAWRTFARSRSHSKDDRILRLEKSLQIGCPVDQVFRAWSRLEDLPNRTSLVQQVRTEGERSHWTLRLGARFVRWDAEITQRIPNQALGWKSISGPKHTGRIDFSPIGNDTLMHITMNYVPPKQMARLFSPMWGKLEDYIDQSLRDFKASLEGKGQLRDEDERTAAGSERRPAGSVGTPAMHQAERLREGRATGTFGSELDRHTQSSRFGGPEGSVEYTRPPDK